MISSKFMSFWLKFMSKYDLGTDRKRKFDSFGRNSPKFTSFSRLRVVLFKIIVIVTNYSRPFISIWNNLCGNKINIFLRNIDKLDKLSRFSTFNFHVENSYHLFCNRLNRLSSGEFFLYRWCVASS